MNPPITFAPVLKLYRVIFFACLMLGISSQALSMPAASTPISPAGSTTDTTPTYTFSEVTASTWYKLYVQDSSGVKVDQWYQTASANCGGGTCSVTPTVAVNGTVNWWVRTWNSQGYGPWSSSESFTLGAPPAATLIGPADDVSDNTPTYSWNAVSSSSWYRLRVQDGTGTRIQQWYTAAQAGCAAGTGICMVTPTVQLADGANTFWVQTWNSIGIGPWSNSMLFNVLPATTGHSWVARHGLTASQYQSELATHNANGLRLTYVSGHELNGQPRYNAIWKIQQGPQWEQFSNLNGNQYQAYVELKVEDGYLPKIVNSYEVGGQLYYTGIFEENTGAVGWQARHGLTASEYQAEFDYWSNQGYRLVHVSGSALGNTAYYTAIWTDESGPNIWASHGITQSTLESVIDIRSNAGYQLVQLNGYYIGNSVRYAAIWHQTSNKRHTQVYGLNSADYQNSFDNLLNQGYEPETVSGYSPGANPLYAYVGINHIWSTTDLDTIDNTVNAAMSSVGVDGLSIAITKDERLVWAKGYGLANQNTGEAVSTNHVFRQASVSKPITSAAIMKLVQDNMLSLDDRVFGNNSIFGSRFGNPADYTANVTAITVRHLLEHSAGGWTNNSSDPMFQNQSWNHDQLISWVISNSAYPLVTPGTTMIYSNFGYCVLGRVIEQVTGQSYEDYVWSALLAPAGVETMGIGGSTLSELRADEVRYYSDFSPYLNNISRMDSHGGWIARPIDLLRLLVHIDGFSNKQDLLSTATIQSMTTRDSQPANSNYAKGWAVNSSNHWWHQGLLTGTVSELARLSNGFNVSLVVNDNYRDPAQTNIDLDGLMWSLIQNVNTWPDYDLF